MFESETIVSKLITLNGLNTKDGRFKLTTRTTTRTTIRIMAIIMRSAQSVKSIR